MRFLSVPSARFLLGVNKGSALIPNTWKAPTIARFNCIQSNVTLYSGEKPAEVVRSASIFEIIRRCIHHKPLKQFELVPNSHAPTNPSFFDYLAVPFLKLYITLTVDKNFKADDFLQGAKQALQYITKNLISQNVSALKEITTPECLHQLITNTERLSEEDKTLLLFKECSTSWIKIGSIKFDYSSNGSENQLLAVKILITNTSVHPIFCDEVLQYMQIKHYCAEFKRVYAEEKKSPWILSKMNIIFTQV